jgi:hypothetical protein
LRSSVGMIYVETKHSVLCCSRPAQGRKTSGEASWTVVSAHSSWCTSCHLPLSAGEVLYHPGAAVRQDNPMIFNDEVGICMLLDLRRRDLVVGVSDLTR